MSQYTEKQLKSMGYVIPITSSRPTPKNDMVTIAKGKFANIIDVLLSDGGRFDPAALRVGPNSPRELVEFVQNFMMSPVTAYAADGEASFSSILPHHVRDTASLGQYLLSLPKPEIPPKNDA